jgi:hypothetical protein
MATNNNPLKDNLAAIIAILVLIAYAVFIFYLLTLTTLPDTAWNRAVYLFGGTEAIAFAAAGFFFGNQVQRQQTTKAEKDAAIAISKKELAEEQNKQLEIEKARTDANINAYRVNLNEVNQNQQSFAPQAAVQQLNDLEQHFNALFPPKTP